jgi:hypothetical protein
MVEGCTALGGPEPAEGDIVGNRFPEDRACAEEASDTLPPATLDKLGFETSDSPVGEVPMTVLG